jgi:hypothetical protein
MIASDTSGRHGASISPVRYCLQQQAHRRWQRNYYKPSAPSDRPLNPDSPRAVISIPCDPDPAVGSSSIDVRCGVPPLDACREFAARARRILARFEALHFVGELIVLD